MKDFKAIWKKKKKKKYTHTHTHMPRGVSRPSLPYATFSEHGAIFSGEELWQGCH